MSIDKKWWGVTVNNTTNEKAHNFISEWTKLYQKLLLKTKN